MDRHLKHPAVLIAGAIHIFFILLFLYTKVVGPIPFTVNNINTLKDVPFSVEGQGRASAAPDEATISFGVTKNSGAVSDAQNQTNTAINSVLENLKGIGVTDKDIKTTNYSVNPNYSFTGESQRITGYNVTQNIELKIKKIENTNKAIDAITQNGGNQVGQIQFGLSRQSKAKLEELARKEAVDNAKQKAQSIAKVTGVRLGKIINVVESEDNFGQPIPLRVGGEDAKAVSPETEIPTGESSINLQITLTYEVN